MTKVDGFSVSECEFLEKERENEDGQCVCISEEMDRFSLRDGLTLCLQSFHIPASLHNHCSKVLSVQKSKKLMQVL